MAKAADHDPTTLRKADGGDLSTESRRRKFSIVTTGAILLLLATSVFLVGQGAAIIAPDPSFIDVSDAPALPRVLLIGDSISMGYTIPVRRRLAGQANVHRIPMNGSNTEVGIANLEAWLGGTKWDVIHFNWGLHDLTVLDSGSYEVPPDRYRKNLQDLVARLKQTRATLIWATITPIPHTDVAILHRRWGEETSYNKIAEAIMNENGIAIDDLYSFALPKLARIQIPQNVHFNEAGNEELAAQVAASILAALKSRSRNIPESQTGAK